MRDLASKRIILCGLLAALLLLAAAGPSHAIRKAKPGYRFQADRPLFGMKIGMNIANVYDTPPDLDWKAGLIIGPFIEFRVNRGLSFQTEFLYSMKGYQTEVLFVDQFNNVTGSGDLNFNLSYLEIPMLFKYSAPAYGNAQPYFIFGPYIAFLLDSETERDGRAYYDPLNDDVDDFDFGISIGAGMDFPFERGMFILDARYSVGLTSIPDGPDNMKNQVFSFTAGFAL